MKHKLPWVGFGMLLLILDGKTALHGAQTGVELCIRTVIPALFPFLTLSALLSGTSLPFLRPLGRLCGIPRGAESLLVPAFLGGYPVGAQCIASACRAGELGQEDAQRMLAFCNNAGPAFLFGMASSLFPKVWMAWALWGIHLISALLVARLIPSRTGLVQLSPRRGVTVSDALQSSLRVMGLICGWVVLFRVVIAFLDRWLLFFLPIEVRVAVTGLLELTNGCVELAKIENLELRFILCSGMLALGGLCVTMQTASVATGVSLKYYFPGKLLQLLFSLALCGILFHGAVYAVPTILLCFALRRKQKRTGIPAPAIV